MLNVYRNMPIKGVFTHSLSTGLDKFFTLNEPFCLEILHKLMLGPPC